MLFSAAAGRRATASATAAFKGGARGVHAHQETRKREGTSDARSTPDSQPVNKEAPSMQIKCCFHNHSSVPLSEVRFARSPGSLSSR